MNNFVKEKTNKHKKNKTARKKMPRSCVYTVFGTILCKYVLKNRISILSNTLIFQK